MVNVIDTLADRDFEFADNGDMDPSKAIATESAGAGTGVAMGAALAYGVPKFGQWIWE